MEHKMRIVRTLCDTESHPTRKVTNHIKRSLKRCDYPYWVIRKGLQLKSKTSQSTIKFKGQTKAMVILLYSHKRFRGQAKKDNQRRRYQDNVEAIHHTVRKQIVASKDKAHKMDKIRVIYCVKCDNCDIHYIREMERRATNRFHKCMVTKLPMAHHVHHYNHSISHQKCELLDRESNWHRRGIKETINIWARTPLLNSDQCHHNLANTCDSFLGDNNTNPPAYTNNY